MERPRGALVGLVSMAVVLVTSAMAPFAAGHALPAPLPADVITLYGSAAQGWGYDPGNLTNPGPTLTAASNASVTVSLHSADGMAHEWFLDYDNDSVVDTDEPRSGVVNGTQTVTFGFLPYRLGTFTYRCSFHPATMQGLFRLTLPDTTPPSIQVYGAFSAAVGEPIPVSARISDPSGIQEAILHYQAGSGGPRWTVMTVNGSDMYLSTIPAQAEPGTVAFYIEALDGWGNTGRSPSNGSYTITVGQPGIVPLPTSGLDAATLALLIAVVAGGAAAVVFAAWQFGRRPPGRAPEERPGNP